MADPKARKPIYRMVSFWLFLLLILYTLAGFIGLPWWLQRQVPEQLKTQLGWEGSVTDIDFNPFTMTLDVEGLDARDADGEPVVAAKQLHVDLTVWRLVTGTIAFESIRLDAPFVRVDLLKDYGVNLVRDWTTHHPATETPEEQSASSEPPHLYFNEIQLNDGEVRFRDYSQDQPETFDIQPLDVTLNDLATFGDDGSPSDYTLSAAIDEQQIDWQGNIGLMPFHSNGHVRLRDISHTTLVHFASPYAPYVVNQGTLSLDTDYALSSAGDFALVTRNGELRIDNLSASLPQADQPFATLAALVVKGITFNLADRSLAIGSVDLDSLKGNVSRDKEGLINVLKPFTGPENGSQDTEADTGGDSSGSGFDWRIDTVTLADSDVHWQDAVPETPADISASGINAKLGPLTQALDEPVPYTLNLRTGESGKISARGQVTFVPFTLESTLSLDDIALAPFEPYVQQTANVAFASGTLNVAGELDLDDQTPALTGTFNGNGQIRNLKLTRAGQSDPILSWSSLRLNPVELNLNPGRLEIGTITLTDPDAHIVRAADGSTNLSGLIKSGDTGDSDTAAQEQDAGSSDKPGFVFRVTQIELENGGFDLADRTIKPVFTTGMRKVNGMIEGLSNVPPQQGSVRMSGELGQRGHVDMKGSIGTLGKKDTTHLELNLDNMAMAELSPYFGRYLGYAVDSGKLRMDLKYDITGPKIKADNRIVMDQLTLGQAVQSKDAVNVPVKLGLTLLRDTDGVIDVDLPIEGNLDDPEFRVGQVVLRAFVNLLAKAATSPFTMLGSVAELAGFSGEELGQVAFVPGTTTLAPGEDKKLELLADALAEKPQLLLNVRGAVAPDIDGLALKAERLDTRLDLTANTDRKQRVQALESQLVDQQGEAALKQLQADNNQTGNERFTSAEWVTTLVRSLTRDVQLPPEALNRLAQQRGAVLQKQLSEQYDIPDDQLFLLAPSEDAKTEMGEDAIRVIVPFAMGAR
ncbi:DUF748 domain-containing protein [Marinobacter halodurans]|uniref:DUF748 domain-containing protein n=1 Tax=Marinobacter halodurans TaxID=2528979 RepID=A0ABY1ZM57_9GAMM|nr:DUF748 domain-containing protein [Marinobacter halodurans]TBW53742.1 DUF748 domain-containing protein [Marinobacter halodurans]